MCGVIFWRDATLHLVMTCQKVWRHVWWEAIEINLEIIFFICRNICWPSKPFERVCQSRIRRHGNRSPLWILTWHSHRQRNDIVSWCCLFSQETGHALGFHSMQFICDSLPRTELKRCFHQFSWRFAAKICVDRKCVVWSQQHAILCGLCPADLCDTVKPNFKCDWQMPQFVWRLCLCQALVLHYVHGRILWSINEAVETLDYLP